MKKLNIQNRKSNILSIKITKSLGLLVIGLSIATTTHANPTFPAAPPVVITPAVTAGQTNQLSYDYIEYLFKQNNVDYNLYRQQVLSKLAEALSLPIGAVITSTQYSNNNRVELKVKTPGDNAEKTFIVNTNNRLLISAFSSYLGQASHQLQQASPVSNIYSYQVNDFIKANIQEQKHNTSPYSGFISIAEMLYLNSQSTLVRFYSTDIKDSSGVSKPNTLVFEFANGNTAILSYDDNALKGLYDRVIKYWTGESKVFFGKTMYCAQLLLL